MPYMTKILAVTRPSCRRNGDWRNPPIVTRHSCWRRIESSVGRVTHHRGCRINCAGTVIVQTRCTSCTCLFCFWVSLFESASEIPSRWVASSWTCRSTTCWVATTSVVLLTSFLHKSLVALSYVGTPWVSITPVARKGLYMFMVGMMGSVDMNTMIFKD